MQEVKMTDQVARHENAGHKIAGHEIVAYFSSIVMLYIQLFALYELL